MASGIVTNRSGALISFVEHRTLQRLSEIGDKIVERAQGLCPVRKGELRGSIHKVVLKTRVKVIADAKNDSGHSYAYYVETGTGRGPAQPFLRPAMMAVLPHIKAAFSDWKFV